MRGKKWLILVASLAVVLLASSVGATRSSFVDLESSSGNTFQAWASTAWVQTEKTDFEAGVLYNVDTSSSAGDVKLGSVLQAQEPTTSVGSEESWYGTWYDTSWSRRAPVVINNPGSGLTDYQVKVDVTYDADMQPDFDDIRFVDSDDSTPLSHWRESYTTSTSATFWVKVPSIPVGGKTIYMYYGNATASSASNGNATFVFFETFPNADSAWNGSADTAQDEPGWVTIQDTTTPDTNDVQVSDEDKGDPSPSGGTHLTFEDCDVGWGSPIDQDLAYVPIDLSGYTGITISYYWQSDDVDSGEGMRVHYSTDSTNGVDGTWNLIAEYVNPADDTWYEETYNLPGSACVTNFKLRFSSKFSSYYEHMYVDDMHIRKYASPEPTSSVGSEESWYDMSWSRRAPVVISNPGSGLTDYQVRVDVTYDADMQPDFDDIRFVDSDDSTPLSHWRESYTASTSATFWVKVPSIPSGAKTIYMYYGNAAASSASDGTATFVFFDDFESGTLNKWTTVLNGTFWTPATDQALSGTYSLRGSGTSSLNKYIVATGLDIADLVLESSWRVSYTGPDIAQAFRASSTTPINDYEINWEGQWTIAKIIGGSWSSIRSESGTIPTDTWFKMTTIIFGTSMKVLKDDVELVPPTGWTDVGAQLASGTIGFRAWTVTSGQYWWIDDVRVRKYACQRTYFSPGTIASQVYDTGVGGARWDALFWDETLPSVDTDIEFEVRAWNEGDPTPSWTPVGGTSPVTSGLPSGRYMQWRATLTTSDTSKTPTLHEVRVYHY